MKICKKCYFTQVPTIGIRTLVMISTVFAKPRCPKDLDWLKGLCGDGALAHEHNGKIYLTELSTGETEIIGKGAQPEFSLDTSKLAWLHGYEAKGCMCKGNRIIHLHHCYLYRPELERFDDNPQLESELQFNGCEEFDLPFFYDVSQGQKTEGQK